MEKPSPVAVPELACTLSLYAGELAETESNRRPERRRGASSRGKRKLLRAGAGSLLSRRGGPGTDDLTGTTVLFPPPIVKLPAPAPAKRRVAKEFDP